MVVIRPELSLDFKPPPPFNPKTIVEFLRELSAMGSVSERELKLEDFIKRLEEEMRKIDAFKRELPLSMLLINDVILHLKEELTRCKKQNVEPVLEEFIPLKKSCDVDEKEEIIKEKDNRDKMNWMSSVQLWNSTDCTNSDSNLDQKQKQNTVVEIKKIAEEENRQVIDDPYKNRTGGRAFMPFKGFSVLPVPVKRKEDKEELSVPGLSLVTPGITKNPIQELGSSILSTKSNSSIAVSSSSFDGQSHLRTGLQQSSTSRKQRRCWSPELHRRFVNALQQLGGSQAATPKQIRELMQVDGLTNDEVKSHLQKYRLHTRRVPSAGSTATNQSLVVLGGLWMGQDQCGETSKQSNSHSDSPQGPLHLTTGPSRGDSMEDEEEDGKSESYSWKK